MSHHANPSISHPSNRQSNPSPIRQLYSPQLPQRGQSTQLPMPLHSQTKQFLDSYFKSQQGYAYCISLQQFVTALLTAYHELWDGKDIHSLVPKMVHKIQGKLGELIVVNQLVKETSRDGMIGLILGIFKSIKEDEVGEVCVTSRVETSVAIDSRVDSCRVQSSTTDSNGASALKAVLESYVQEIGEACMKELQGRVEGMLDRVQRQCRKAGIALDHIQRKTEIMKDQKNVQRELIDKMRAMGEELRLVKEELTSTKLLKEKYEELIVGQLARNSHSNTTISQNKSQMSGKDISLLSLKDQSPIMHKQQSPMLLKEQCVATQYCPQFYTAELKAMPCSSVAPQIDQTHSRITYISLVSNKHPLQTDRSNILEQTNRSRRTLTSHTSTSPMQVKSASPLPPRINLATPKSKIVFTNTGNIYPLQLPFPQLSPSNPQHNNSPAFLR